MFELNVSILGQRRSRVAKGRRKAAGKREKRCVFLYHGFFRLAWFIAGRKERLARSRGCLMLRTNPWHVSLRVYRVAFFLRSWATRNRSQSRCDRCNFVCEFSHFMEANCRAFFDSILINVWSAQCQGDCVFIFF